MNAKNRFSEAMRADMERKELSEAAVGKALGISQQAVHKWLERGFPPLSRVNDLREVLGATGEFAKLSHDDLFGDGKTSRTPNPQSKPAASWRTDHHIETLLGLFDMLPKDPTTRARVFGECALVISAALSREPLDG